VYSTHYLGEVESLGASVAVIDAGVVVARGSIDEITGAATGGARGSLEDAFVHLTRAVAVPEPKEAVDVG
jgi:ABC-type Na+ transport system ATPase subunit NatA